jgi:ribosome-associated protein
MQNVEIYDEYITLGQLLKITDCISSGGQAKPFLQEVAIQVNGEAENRRGRKLYAGDTIEVEGHGSFKVGKKS